MAQKTSKKEPVMATTSVFSGIEAQHDPANGVPGNSLEDIESDLEQMGDVSVSPELEAMNYEKFIFITKRDVASLSKMIDPLTKSSTDEYGKTVYVHCPSPDKVEFRYVNRPFSVSMTVDNASGKTIGDFYITASLLKKLIANAFSSLVIVEEDGQFNIAVCGGLLYLETKQLKPQFFEIVRKPTPHKIDREKALYTLKRVGSTLGIVERASERSIVVRSGKAYFSTGSFCAKVDSPFMDTTQDFVLYKTVADLIASTCDIVRGDLKYGIHEPVGDTPACITVDAGSIYLEMAVNLDISSFYSPITERTLSFGADVLLMNDSILQLLNVVRNMDYLSDVVGIEFKTDKVVLTVFSSDMSKESKYPFTIADGKPETVGEMRASVSIIRNYFDIIGSDVRYAFTTDGLGLVDENGIYLIRKNQ